MANLDGANIMTPIPTTPKLAVVAYSKASKEHAPRMRMLNESFVEGVWDVPLCRLSDAQAEIQALRADARPGWQPIATAPKDGKPIILGFAIDEEYGGFVAQGRWHEEDDDGVDNMGHDAGFMDDQFDFFKCARSFGNPAYQDCGLQPTHWMPLPPAPTIDAAVSASGEGGQS